jgi:hypothetical protein
VKLRTVGAEIYTTRDRRHTLRADRSGHRGRAADPQPRVRARDLTLLAWPIAAAALAGASSVATAWIVTSLALAGSTIVLGAAPGAPGAAYISVALFAASYTTLSWCSHHLGRAPGSGSPS